MASRKMYFSNETWDALTMMMAEHGYASRSAVVRSLVEVGHESATRLQIEAVRVKALRAQLKAAQKTRFCTCGKPVRFDSDKL